MRYHSGVALHLDEKGLSPGQLVITTSKNLAVNYYYVVEVKCKVRRGLYIQKVWLKLKLKLKYILYPIVYFNMESVSSLYWLYSGMLYLLQYGTQL